MRTISKVLMRSIACAVVAGAVVSCGGGGTDYGGGGGTPGASPPVVRSASLDGTQAGTGATGVGRGAVVVNPTTMAITGGATFSGLTGAPTGAHIHRANTTIAVSLDQAADNATATVPPNTTLSAADYAELLAGTLYFNIHTVANGNGEIRGQITGTTGVTTGLATLNGAQEVPANASAATGQGTIVFDSTTRAILVCYVTHNVANTTVAHIHTGAPGVSGPADVVSLTQGTSIYTCPTPATLSAQNVADMNIGYTYFNVHSSNNSCPPAPTCAAGEIRGQIAIQ